MPVAASIPAILTVELLNPHTAHADGYVANQDGTVNSASNPAALGSTVTLYVTGMGAAQPQVPPGAVAKTATGTPDTAVYWFTSAPLTVQSIPGDIAAMFEIPLTIPTTVMLDGSRVFVELTLSPSGAAASNAVGIYVK
jgi:uncharacterized protein (TIGR03437 family)